jgi:hypothetical protein
MGKDEERRRRAVAYAEPLFEIELFFFVKEIAGSISML